MSIQKFILIKTWLFQIIKNSWVINMVLLIYLLKHIFMMTGLKMKNQGKGKVTTKSDNEESTDTT